MVDYFTKYAEAVPLPDRRATTVAKAIYGEWICRHGVIEILHSDQTQEFESDLSRIVCIVTHKKNKVVAFSSQGNSVCQRLNGTLLFILKPCLLNHTDDWDTLIPSVMLAYRSIRHSSTGFTPAYLHNDRELRLPPQVVFPAPSREPQMVTDYARQLRHN